MLFLPSELGVKVFFPPSLSLSLLRSSLKVDVKSGRGQKATFGVFGKCGKMLHVACW